MLTLSKRYLELEQAAHRGTGGVSSENRHLGFVPAFMDTRTGKVVGQSQVQGDGPLGQLNAKSYSVEDKGDRLVFRGGVRARVEGR